MPFSAADNPLRRAPPAWSRRARTRIWEHRWWLLAAVLGAVVGVTWLVGQALADARDAFETRARIAHRLLSQRAVQHEAVLTTLALMQPGQVASLSQVYPQFLQVIRRDAKAPWPDALQLPALPTLPAIPVQPETPPRRGPWLARADLPNGRVWLMSALLDAAPSAHQYALELDLQAMVPWDEWPFAAQPGALPVAGERVWLALDAARWNLHPAQPGGSAPVLRTFTFSKHLASQSQPFDLVVEQDLDASALPWSALLAWVALWWGALGLVALALRQRRARLRAEELLRLGQVARLNALGELAAGLAHELNQPLTAVLASTQAASRLIDDDAPDLPTLRGALQTAAQQARRAADVVTRLRRVIERPQGQHHTTLDLAALVQRVLGLLEPQCRALDVHPQCLHDEPAPAALGDPVAVEQIVHNLVSNALQALQSAPPGSRRLQLQVQRSLKGHQTLLRVQDNGPGLPASVRAHLFEPFVSTRPGGLGLGLSLCSTLASEMGGQLRHEDPVEGGACFVLELPQPDTAATIDR